MGIDMLGLLELLVLNRGQIVLVSDGLALRERSELPSGLVKVDLRNSGGYACVVRTHEIGRVHACKFARQLRKRNVEIDLHGVLGIVLIRAHFAAVMVQHHVCLTAEATVIANL